VAWLEDEPVRGGFPDPSLLALSGIDRMRAIVRGHMFRRRSITCSAWSR
jgi:hypothetical protein